MNAEQKKALRKPRTGRPKAPIDWDQVDKWLIGGANGAQIAATIGIHQDTLYLRCEEDHKVAFSAYAAQKRAIGDKLIHQTQFEVAVKNKNTTMLIWLGKQRCGQKENHEEIQVDAKTLEQFTLLMQSFERAQEARIIANNNNITDSKSE